MNLVNLGDEYIVCWDKDLVQPYIVQVSFLSDK